MFKKILKKPQAILGLSLIIILIGIAVLAPNDPGFIDITLKNSPPSEKYPLGTDQIGRCELSRLLYGARYSVLVSVPSLMVLSIIGLVIVLLSTCIKGFLNQIITWVCDIFIAFPALLIAIAVIGILGDGLFNIALAMILPMWAWFVKVARAFALIEMGKNYILVAKIGGCSTSRLIFKHLLANVLPSYTVFLSTGIASSIMTVSSFAFLGLGFPPGTAEWGAMLNDARSSIYSNPMLLLYPGICILIAAVGFNLFGESLRDSLSIEEVQV